MTMMGSVDISFTNSSQIAYAAQQTVNDVKDNIVYKVDIISTNGISFKNGIINTTFIAVVYKGKENITATLPPSAFVWTKINSDGTIDQDWTDAHANIGNAVTISKNDVENSATFKCDINIDDDQGDE